MTGNGHSAWPGPRTPSPTWRALVCPDSFKGTFTSVEVARLIGHGPEQAGITTDLAPLADGGEGTLSVLLRTLGGHRQTATVRGPLGEPTAAEIGFLPDGTAIVEVAAACGLTLLPQGGLRPTDASTAGVGDLIANAAQLGARHVLVAAGGSCTTDGGEGAARVLEELPSDLMPQLTILSDTRTPFEAAARVFGPQKGASTQQVRELTDRLAQIAARLPRDPNGRPYTGAAGGLAGGLWSRFDAQLVSGADFVIAAASLESRMASADLIVTGEGQADGQSLHGKLVGAVAGHARRLGRPVALVVGRNALTPLQRRRLKTVSIVEAGDAQALSAAGHTLANQRLPWSQRGAPA